MKRLELDRDEALMSENGNNTFIKEKKELMSSNLIAAQKITTKVSKPKRNFMCSQTEPARTYWDYFVMIIATWNSITLPIEMSF